jgi:arabinoxylan arabinofuranohydrolase
MFARYRGRLAAAALAATALLPATSRADNPVVQTLYTADPAPLVHDGTLYLYTTHDEDVTVNEFFTMNDWRVYSSTDVVNWTDHGSPLHYQDFGWAGGNAWAGQVIYRNGTFYFYVPVVRTDGANAIGVATSVSPFGPFEDALGSPLVTSDCGDIDPTVWLDTDGQAYLYWGNPNLCYVKLNEDMVSYQGEVVRVPMETGGFGIRSDSERPTSYEEGPWFYKRDALYYMVYPGGPLPEHIAYSTSTGPTGPWSYQGIIMPAEGASFTNHPGVVDYKGKSLFFYHNGALPDGGGFKRSVCVEEFTYGADGSIPELRMTTEGASAVDVLNPFAQVEAETIAWHSGVETEVCSEGGMNVTDVDDGDYIELKDVEFGAGATSFEMRVAAGSGDSGIQLRLDTSDGVQVGDCAVANTGGDQTWATQSCTIDGATGRHDLFLRFTGGGFKFNWWRFAGPGDPGTVGAGGQGGIAGGGSNDGGGSPGGAASMGGAASTGGITSTAGSPAVEPTAPGGFPQPDVPNTGGAATVPPATSSVAPAIPGSASPSASGTSSVSPIPALAPGSTATPAETDSGSPDDGGCRVQGRHTGPSSLATTVLGFLAFAILMSRTGGRARRRKTRSGNQVDRRDKSNP